MDTRDGDELLVEADCRVVAPHLLGHVAGQALDHDPVDACASGEVVEGSAETVDRETVLDP